jgi:hypothetical protein
MQIRVEQIGRSGTTADRLQPPESKFRRADPSSCIRPGLKIDVQQGIARMRRHVAPARLLC